MSTKQKKSGVGSQKSEGATEKAREVAELNRQHAQSRGWQWNPYGPGFTRVNGQSDPVRVSSEREVFEFVGLPYLEPKDRQ